MSVHIQNNVHVLVHPLVSHKLAILRAKETPPHHFRQTLHELSWLLAFPALQKLQVTPVEVQTPLESMTAETMCDPKPCLVSILRAGNGLIDGFSQICPEASVGHLGLYRDHETAEPISYYSSLPDEMEKRQVILGDPMLATGGSAVMAIETLQSMGVVDIVFACLVAAPEGVAAVHGQFPDVPIVTAALDRELNEMSYILPGLGDAGDRIYGTVRS